MYKLLKIDISNSTERNGWFLVLEIFWATFLGAAATFNTAFAIRLGATDAQIGLLSSLPALLALLVLIPAGRVINRLKKPKPWLLGSLALYRTGFLVIAIIPWLKFAGVPSGTLLVFWLIILSLPAHFFNVGFIPMLSDVIPPSNRANVFTYRNVIYNATLSVTVYLLGQWLDRVEFPINYQVMYVVTYFISLLSLFYLIKIQVPEKYSLIQPQQSHDSWRKRWGNMRTNLAAYPDFNKIVVNTWLHGFGLWMVGPIYMLYFVRDLQATDAWIGLQGAIASLSTIAGFVVWRKGMQRIGEPRTLRYTIVLAGLFPLLVGLSGSLTAILLWVALNGLVAGGISLSHMNTLMRVTPAHDKPGYTAIYMTIMNIGAFLGPMLGVWLSDRYGFSLVLIACGLFSILGSFSFWVWPILAEEPS
jgi:MFS family permease